MMKSVACLRPAACSQQLASFSVLKEPAKTYTSRVALICRPASSGLLPALKCHLPRSSGRKVTLTVTAASRISARQVRTVTRALGVSTLVRKHLQLRL